jgi:hypothetical protein
MSKKFIITEIVQKDSGQAYEGEKIFFADTIGQASEKIEALTLLSQVLSHEDLMDTVKLIQEKPALINEIRTMAREMETMSENQMLISIPKFVNRIIKASQ